MKAALIPAAVLLAYTAELGAATAPRKNITNTLGPNLTIEQILDIDGRRSDLEAIMDFITDSSDGEYDAHENRKYSTTFNTDLKDGGSAQYTYTLSKSENGFRSVLLEVNITRPEGPNIRYEMRDNGAKARVDASFEITAAEGRKIRTPHDLDIASVYDEVTGVYLHINSSIAHLIKTIKHTK